jgi:hypothetical protein
MREKNKLIHSLCLRNLAQVKGNKISENKQEIFLLKNSQ